MDNNANEGRPGERINQTIKFSSAALHQRPNVILLNVGSNDCVYHEDLDEAPARLKQLLNDIFGICPDATIVLSPLGPSSNTDYMQRFAGLNSAMPEMVESFVKHGKHIIIADTSNIDIGADMFDDLHLNDAGYYRLAKTFHAALIQANINGWITKPVSVSRKTLILETTCTSLPSWEQLPMLFAGFKDAPPDALYFFADLDGDSRDDFLVLSPDGGLQPYINLPNPLPDPGKIVEWWPTDIISTPVSSKPGAPLLLFADLTAAKFSSLIYVYPDGTIYAAQNLGPDSNEGRLVFKDPVLIADTRQAPSDPLGIHFQDIDGDGRADLLYLSLTGTVTAWLNRADLGKHSKEHPEPNALNINWVPQGEVVSDMVGVARKDVRLADLNGDGLADYLWVNPEDGSVEAWLNKGLEGWYKQALESEMALGKKNWVESGWSKLAGKQSGDARLEKGPKGKKKLEDDPIGEEDVDRRARAVERLARQKDVEKAAKPGNIYGGGGVQSLMVERTYWNWEELGIVFDGAGRGDEGLRIGVGAPGVSFADIAGSRRAAYVFVERNGAVWGWGNTC